MSYIEFTSMFDGKIIFCLKHFGNFISYEIPAYGIRKISVEELKCHKEACKYHGERVKDSDYIKLLKEKWLTAKRVI